MVHSRELIKREILILDLCEEIACRETQTSIRLENTNAQIEVGCLFNMVHFVAKEGVLFRKFPELCKLLCKNNTQLGQNYSTDVASRRSGIYPSTFTNVCF